MAHKGLKFAVIITAISLFVPFNFSLIQAVKAEESPANELVQELSDLDKEIEAKKKEIEALQERSNSYKNQIERAKNKALSLETELAILSNKIAKIEIDIETTEKKIEEIGLEIKSLETQVQEKESLISQNKGRIAEFLRLMHRNDQKSYLEVLTVNESFSEIFDQMQYVEELQADLQGVLNEVQGLKEELEKKKQEMEDKKREEEESKNDLLKMQSSLEEQMTGKEMLLNETFASEKKFQNWLLQSKYEEEQIDSEIASLEKKIRQKLEESDKAFSEGESTGSVVLSWPVDPGRGITSTFHDPDYPFRYIFEHPAIDIRAYQSTQVRAAAPGYVGRVKNGGVGGYSYIMLIHSNGISTVYGHLSKLSVQEDTYVIRGQVIGLSGGMPGTSGAGKLTTGPHLHFEVRSDGLPVNPLDYLP